MTKSRIDSAQKELLKVCKTALAFMIHVEWVDSRAIKIKADMRAAIDQMAALPALPEVSKTCQCSCCLAYWQNRAERGNE